MATIIDKNLSEEDIKNRYITPALNDAGWDSMHMRMEFPYTAGRVMAQGSFKVRKKARFLDYLLFVEDNYPIAIVEAKNAHRDPAYGMQQAINYALDNDLYFAYSTNGEKFVEHDMFTGKERTIEMNEFPSPAELKERLYHGKKYSNEELGLIEEPYYTDSDSFEPRYYQRIAINRTIEAVAKGEKRILLVMATGTGKTYTAFQIIHRLHHSGKAKKILYLADRNILIDQTMSHDFKPFRKFMTKIKSRSADSSYELFMSLYGQWVKPETELAEGEKQPYEAYDPNFFDFIVVDECHRSSIKEDKEWHKILTYFSSAVQLGLTATPKAAEGANNLEYFGNPVYTYSLRQGIEDGFLAPYRVTKSFIDVDLEGYEPEEDELDLFGNPLFEKVYTRNNYGRDLNIKKRQIVVANRITQMMKVIGRMTKTIVFCPDENEALIMRDLLISMNEDMVKRNPNYIVRITSSDTDGKKLLDDFIEPYTAYPVIATTSELLTTGVDCKTCGLIVIDKEVNNITVFKQMVGRGTRIFEPTDKLNFEILDFRNATANFNDPDFDGPADTHKTYPQRRNEKAHENAKPYELPEDGGMMAHERHKLYVEGREVNIVHEVVQFLGEDGRTLHTEKLTDFTRRAIKGKYPTLDSFQGAWFKADKKQAVLDELQENDVLIEAIKEENPELKDCDDYDIICHIAFDKKPLTRKERVEGVKKRDYLSKYEGKARQVIEGLMEKYSETGVTNIENTQILNLNPFSNIAKRPRIINGIFNGPADYTSTIRELENYLYMEG